ncbi:MAG TPA: hypothetical protein PLO53_02740 [Candidatus Hydrogenedentes bacterium]|nr:hypothetical protein [Candidatus Hydrogenedentota bacterium]HPU96852.1 hypothetical protein [Candidatus Hydrogenedentota bacterium]
MDRRSIGILFCAAVVAAMVSWSSAFHHHGSGDCGRHHHPECPVCMAGTPVADPAAPIIVPLPPSFSDLPEDLPAAPCLPARSNDFSVRAPPA